MTHAGHTVASEAHSRRESEAGSPAATRHRIERNSAGSCRVRRWSPPAGKDRSKPGAIRQSANFLTHGRTSPARRARLLGAREDETGARELSRRRRTPRGAVQWRHTRDAVAAGPVAPQRRPVVGDEREAARATAGQRRDRQAPRGGAAARRGRPGSPGKERPSPVEVGVVVDLGPRQVGDVHRRGDVPVRDELVVERFVVQVGSAHRHRSVERREERSDQ